MKYFVGFLISLGLIIFVLIMLLSGGGKKADVPKTSKSLESYSTTDAQASILIDGPINSDKIHEQVRITVDNNQVMYEHLNGYDGSVVDQQTYQNNEEAYRSFLHALALAGFTDGDRDAAHADYRGYCPLGQRYVYELNQDGSTLLHFWATNCDKNVPRTYLGDSQLALTLFQKQVPDYDTRTQNIKW